VPALAAVRSVWSCSLVSTEMVVAPPLKQRTGAKYDLPWQMRVLRTHLSANYSAQPHYRPIFGALASTRAFGGKGSSTVGKGSPTFVAL